MSSNQTLEIEKFPHLDFQKRSLGTLNELIACLQKRIELLEGEMEDDDAHVENEKRITVIETTMKLERFQTSAIKKRVYIEDYEKSCLNVMEEMATKFNEVMAKGRLLKNESSQLREFFEKQNIKNYEVNLEAKIRDYLTVKELLNPAKDDSKGKLKKLK